MAPPTQYVLKRKQGKGSGGCCGGGARLVPVTCSVVPSHSGPARLWVGDDQMRVTDCKYMEESNISIRFSTEWATYELFGERARSLGTEILKAQQSGEDTAPAKKKSSHHEADTPEIPAPQPKRKSGQAAISTEKSQTIELTELPDGNEDNDDQDGEQEDEEDGATPEYKGRSVEDILAELTDLMHVYSAMKVDYKAALGRKAGLEKEKKKTTEVDESIGIILMGRKALMKDLQKLHDELQDTMNWCAENDPDNANESVGGSHAFNDARTILAKCQERMLDEDETFNVGHTIDPKKAPKAVSRGGAASTPAKKEDLKSEATRASQVAAPEDVKVDMEEEEYEKKEGELDNINQYLGDDLDMVDVNIRTIVHGFEEKVSPGHIARILKPKNEKNWILMEDVATGISHWTPSWVVSKGFFRTLAAYEGVCEENDLVEYLKGPLDGWVLIRNVTNHATHADWVPLANLPDHAVEVKPKKEDGPVQFHAFHDYKSKDGKITLKKGEELKLLNGPTNGWIGVSWVNEKKKAYVPYWVLPHGLRPADGGKKKEDSTPSAAPASKAEEPKSSASRGSNKSIGDAAEEHEDYHHEDADHHQDSAQPASRASDSATGAAAKTSTSASSPNKVLGGVKHKAKAHSTSGGTSAVGAGAKAHVAHAKHKAKAHARPTK